MTRGVSTCLCLSIKHFSNFPRKGSLAHFSLLESWTGISITDFSSDRPSNKLTSFFPLWGPDSPSAEEFLFPPMCRYVGRTSSSSSSHGQCMGSAALMGSTYSAHFHDDIQNVQPSEDNMAPKEPGKCHYFIAYLDLSILWMK